MGDPKDAPDVAAQPGSAPAPDGGGEAARRRERLAAALRENLKRRKAQARTRRDSGEA